MKKLLDILAVALMAVVLLWDEEDAIGSSRVI